MSQEVSKWQGFTYTIIGVAVGLLVLVSLMPTALVQISNGTGAYTYTAGKSINPGVWATVSILLPIAAVVAVALVLLRKADFI